jgi:lysine-specific demethylase 8
MNCTRLTSYAGRGVTPRTEVHELCECTSVLNSTPANRERNEKLCMNELIQIPWPETVDAFQTTVAERVPVIFRNAAADWPCVRRWTPAYLRSRLADKVVKATYTPQRRYRPDPERGHYAPHDMLDLPFCEFMDNICSESDDASYYLHRQNLEQQFPELRGDIRVPNYLSGAAMLMVSLWMGPAGSVTPIHHDFTDNLFVQAQGRKRVILYHPEPEGAFYRSPFQWTNGRSSWHVSRVGSTDHVDLDAHPQFQQARAYEVVVEPGDILFIPNFYWHEVHSIDTPSISLSYWWDERSLSEIEVAIAKLTDFVVFYDAQPLEWRSMIEAILRDRLAASSPTS